MGRFIVFIVSVLLASTAIAADKKLVLSQQVIQSFQQVSSKWSELAQKHVEIGQQLQSFDLKNSASAIKFLEKSDIGKLLEQALVGSSFSQISDVISFSKRFLGIKYYIEIKSSQSGVKLVDMVKILQLNIDRLEESGVDERTIRTMEAQLSHHKQRADTIEYMLSLLDDEDKKFADENLVWLKNLFAAEPASG